MGGFRDLLNRFGKGSPSPSAVRSSEAMNDFGTATIGGKLAEQLGIAGSVDPEEIPTIFARVEALVSDRPENEPRFYLRRDDGGMAVGIEVASLDEAQELAAGALREDAEVELTDYATGTITRGKAILDLNA